MKDGISSEDHWVLLPLCLQRCVALAAAAVRDVDGGDQWKGPEELGCSHIIHVWDFVPLAVLEVSYIVPDYRLSV
jgi:hypothetical protein